jgi:hypothetical protein
MSSRDYLKHFIDKTPARAINPGDEYWDSANNKLYKAVLNNGTTFNMPEINLSGRSPIYNKLTTQTKSNFNGDVNFSNGGTVTAITRTGNGTGCTTIPTLTISAPTSANGTQAKAIVYQVFAGAATVASGGTGYTNGGTITVQGGTGTSATYTVTSVGGVITSVAPLNFGTYTVIPANPVSVTGGGGSDATLNLTYGIQNSFIITDPGSGYIEQPTITFTGDGSVAATAYATIGSGTSVKGLGNITTFSTPNSQVLALVDKNSAGNYPVNILPAFSMVPPQNGFGLSYLGMLAGGYFATNSTSSSGAYIFATGIATPLNGGGGSSQFQIGHVASAVNYHTVAGSATNFAPVHSVAGSDPSISMALQSKGTGGINLSTGSTGVNISNGNTVTAITIINSSSGYTTVPGVTISAPTTFGGTTATANVFVLLNSGSTISSGGTGYANGDIVTVVGGTGSAATMTVNTYPGFSNVISYTSTYSGSYSVVPSPTTLTTANTTGLGTGFTLTPNYSLRQVNVVTAGSGYIEQPTVTFSSGAATAYATVGTYPIVRSLGTTLNFYTPAGISFIVGNSSNPNPVNYLQVSPNSAGQPPYISAVGTDANIPFYIFSKNTGNIELWTGGGRQFIVADQPSAVNYLQAKGSNTGNLVQFSAQGSDPAIGINYNTKGFTGSHRFNLNTSEALRIEQFGSTGVVNRFSMFANISGGAPLFAVRGTDPDVGFDFSTQGAGNYKFSTNTVSNGTGTQQFAIAHTANAVNYVQVTGNVTGNSPIILFTGSDPGVGGIISSKGSGGISIFNNSGVSRQLRVGAANITSAVNWITIDGSISNNAPKIGVDGNSDSNIDLLLTSKGTGAVRTANTFVAGLISGGTF